ncbi:hypothetical protein [Dactylosporangium sp. CA-233914]|uniref:hypothetical protein n=1 Tax=Dactylosporangium sp. CA-233914 TaxID=3239934 RepID=UPI003D943BAF
MVARLNGRITVQQVAFPQYGILTNPGTATLLEETLAAGVDAIGGLDRAGLDRWTNPTAASDRRHVLTATTHQQRSTRLRQIVDQQLMKGRG